MIHFLAQLFVNCSLAALGNSQVQFSLVFQQTCSSIVGKKIFYKLRFFPQVTAFAVFTEIR